MVLCLVDNVTAGDTDKKNFSNTVTASAKYKILERRGEKGSEYASYSM